MRSEVEGEHSVWCYISVYTALPDLASQGTTTAVSSSTGSAVNRPIAAHAELDTLTLRFPVVCPGCKQESLFHALRHEILQALSEKRPIRLSARCCPNHGWIASPLEVEQIQQYADLPDAAFAP